MRALIVIAILLLSAGPALGKKKAEEEIDYLALAARLVQDGHFDRASQALEEVDTANEELDKKMYFVLKGLVALQKKLYIAAAEAFEQAVLAGNEDPLVLINWGRALFGAKKYRKAVDVLVRAGEAARAEPKAEMLLCRAYWELSEAGNALAVLSRASKRFPESIEFARLEMSYLIKLGLYRELADIRERFLRRQDVEAKDFVAIGEALRKGGRLKEAKMSLEAARLRFEGDVALTVQLARVYMDNQELLSSAVLLEQAARQDPKYWVEAAEMYRRSGRLVRALVINKRVPDQQKKMRQRLQILLELERFEMISGMEARLSRLGLLADQQIRYALAYGLYQTKDFTGAERHILNLTDPAFFEKGIALRKAIQSCKEAGWLCE